MYRDISQELRGVIEPVVEDHGLELVDAELVRGKGPAQVRVTVDNERGDGRVGVDACAALSRELGTQLDVHEVVRGAYRLEVSSPGLDRLLGREKDFAAAIGLEVKIETREPVSGRRRFRGTLRAFDGDVATVDVDGQPVALPFANVARARTVYAWSRADFARPEPATAGH